MGKNKKPNHNNFGNKPKLSISIKIREGHEVVFDLNNMNIEEALQSMDDNLRFNHDIDMKEKINDVRAKSRL